MTTPIASRQVLFSYCMVTNLIIIIKSACQKLNFSLCLPVIDIKVILVAMVLAGNTQVSHTSDPQEARHNSFINLIFPCYKE